MGVVLQFTCFLESRDGRMDWDFGVADLQCWLLVQRDAFHPEPEARQGKARILARSLQALGSSVYFKNLTPSPSCKRGVRACVLKLKRG
jgi:hypothetical protein